MNIINQSSDIEVSQAERTGPGGEQILDVMISKKVNEGIAKGSFDKSMRAAFGVTRKGS